MIRIGSKIRMVINIIRLVFDLSLIACGIILDLSMVSFIENFLLGSSLSVFVIFPQPI